MCAYLRAGLAFQEPYIQLLLQLTSGSQQHTCADGGLLAVHIACRYLFGTRHPWQSMHANITLIARYALHKQLGKRLF